MTSLLIPRVFLSRQGGILLALLLFFLLILASTVGFALIEGWSLADSFYMSIITISTVGYGEVKPLSASGRIFTSFIIIAGLATAVYGSSRLGQLIVEGELLGALGRRRMTREISKIKDHFIVCGYGRVGKPVSEGLKKEGYDLCIIDIKSDLEEELHSGGYLYLLGDSTEEDVLQAAGIEKARAVLALLPSDADNVYLTLTAKGMNPDVQVIARAADSKAESKLKRGGADKVVSPYSIAGARVLQAAIKPTVVEFMDLATHRSHLALSLEEFVVEKSSPLTSQSLGQAEIRSRYGVIVVAIKRNNGEMVFNPAASELISRGDTLVAIGPESDLKRLAQACGDE